MADLECDDHSVTEAEHDFYKAFVTILEHLKNRALKAEAEVKRQRQELNALRDTVQYMTAIHTGPMEAAPNGAAPGPSIGITYLDGEFVKAAERGEGAKPE